MTADEKVKILEALAKSGIQAGQIIIENTGTITYNDHRGNDRQKDEDADASSAAKDDILKYVNRLKPVVKTEYQDCYDEMWQGILELKEVKLHIYNKGKQQDTTFNRNLVAQIIHLISGRVFVPQTNNSQMVEFLEPEKGYNHPVRQKLGESPDKVIKKSIDTYMDEVL